MMTIIKIGEEVIDNKQKNNNYFERLMSKLFSNAEENNKLKKVSYWYLEIDETKKQAHREIGFNKQSEPVIFFPNNKNPYGFWADSPVSFIIEQHEKIDINEFEKIWEKINSED